MTITIRRGTAADAADLAALAARTFHETFAADNRPEDMELHLDQQYGPAQQGAELLDPSITTLLVDIDGQLAGLPLVLLMIGYTVLSLWIIAQPITVDPGQPLLSLVAPFASI